MQVYLYHFIEIFCALLAILFYRNLRAKKMGLLLPFLLFITLAEYLAILQRNVFHTSTYGTNYLIMLVEWLFYNFLFLRFTTQPLLRQFIRISLPLLSIGILVGYFFFPGYYPAFYYCIMLVGFFLSFTSLGYMYSRFLRDEANDLTDDPVIWVAVGVVVFFSGVSIVFSLYQFIQMRQIKLWGEPIYALVPRLLSLFLYSCLSIAIITCRKTIPSSSVS